MRISHEICERNHGTETLLLVGIERRGEPLARRICRNIESIEGQKLACGSIDIAFYRDDLSPIWDNPLVRRAELPFDVNGKTVVLVDDVLYTGRTARAAMDAVLSCGRPQKIQLAVMIDRGHRELPIRADFVGKNLPTSRAEQVELCVEEIDGENSVYLLK